MLLGRSYEETLLAFPAYVLTRGATWTEVKRAAKKLGVTMAVARAFDLDTDGGILCIESDKWGDQQHVVILVEGMVVDTDGTLWSADDFLAANNAKPTTLLGIVPPAN